VGDHRAVEGLLGWVIMGRVLGKAGSRDSVASKYLRLSCGDCSVIGVDVVGL